jgi:hypothetical protein
VDGIGDASGRLRLGLVTVLFVVVTGDPFANTLGEFPDAAFLADNQGGGDFGGFFGRFDGLLHLTGFHQDSHQLVGFFEHLLEVGRVVVNGEFLGISGIDRHGMELLKEKKFGFRIEIAAIILEGWRFFTVRERTSADQVSNGP